MRRNNDEKRRRLYITALLRSRGVPINLIAYTLGVHRRTILRYQKEALKNNLFPQAIRDFREFEIRQL